MASAPSELFGPIESRKGKILVLSLDYDNCTFVLGNSGLAKCYRSSYGAAVEDLQRFLDEVSKGYDNVIVQNGSARQDHHGDEFNEDENMVDQLKAAFDSSQTLKQVRQIVNTSKMPGKEKYRKSLNAYSNGRCITEFPAYVEAQKARSDVDHTSWEFSLFSSVDAQRELAAGSTYLDPSIRREPVFREDKVDLLAHQMTYYRNLFPEQEIDFLFVDDFPKSMAARQACDLPKHVPEKMHFASVEYDFFDIASGAKAFTREVVLSVNNQVPACADEACATPFADAGAGSVSSSSIAASSGSAESSGTDGAGAGAGEYNPAGYS